LSYQVIARKWRPQSFEEVSGQGHVTRALRNAIRSGRIPHALLFTGPRGVGKTTLARLVARCLNCEKGPTDTPCGVCPACLEITEGRSTDVQEIDAASRTGVDDVREIIESIRYAASPGRHRIFIVDEVHMLSTPAFNALLKTLEEPPPRSLFIFATTNPEKIPFTVLSRCQRHDLRRIALATVSERLAEICRAEGIAISPKSLAAIAREGEGSMRDAQTLLDQIVAYGGQQIGDDVVAELLDLVDRNVLRAIVVACIAGDARDALAHVATALSGGSEAGRVAEALLELLRDLVVLRLAPDAEGLVEGTDEERAELAALAARSEPARLRRMFRALVREIEDLSFAPKPSAVLEMAVIRLATLPAGDDVEKLLGRLDALERRLAAAGAGAGLGSGGAAGAATAPREPLREGPRPTAREASPLPPRGARPAPGGNRSAPSSGPSRDQPRSEPAAPRTKSGREPEEPDGFDGPPAPDPIEAAFDGPPLPAAFGDDRIEEAIVAGDDDFDAAPDAGGTVGPATPARIFDRLRARALEQDRARHASLEHAECVALLGDRMRLRVATAFHAERVRARTAELEAIAQPLFGRAIRIEVEQEAAKTQAEESADSRERSRRRRQEALNSEPVNLAIEILAAEIVEIRPLGEER